MENTTIVRRCATVLQGEDLPAGHTTSTPAGADLVVDVGLEGGNQVRLGSRDVAVIDQP